MTTAFVLGPAAAAAGYRLVSFDTVCSTSAEAMARARGGDQGPLWVVAAEQSEAVGRRGSRWVSPPGNLAATLLLTTSLQAGTVAQLGFVAGVALSRALNELCPRGDPTFQLKWPNDMLAGGRKLAGILLQSDGAGPRRAAAVGIGVNVATAPQAVPNLTTSLADLGLGATAPELFQALTEAWVAVFGLWHEGRGFELIRREWLGRAAGLGGPIAVRTGTRVVRGVFETIDREGQLVVRTSDGSAPRISAGDVHLGSAASAREEAA